MSNKSANTLLIFLLFGITSCLYLLHISGNLKLTHPKSTPLSKDAHQPQIQPSGYIFSRPSNGTLTKTQHITVNFTGNDKAIGTIKSNPSVNKNQSVILFDKNKNLLPLGGQVSNITTNKNDQSIITITLPNKTRTQNLSKNLEIITSEAIAMQRFPLSALQQDINRNKFVWVSKKTDNENHYSAYKTYLKRPIIGRSYFVAGHPVNAYSFIILNPDDALQDQTTYKMAQIEFKAPSLPPIKHALNQYKKHLKEKRLKAHVRQVKNCGAGGQNRVLESAEGKACGEGAKKEMTPKEIFDSILSRQPPPALSTIPPKS